MDIFFRSYTHSTQPTKTFQTGSEEVTVAIERAGEAEMDEMWSFVGKKKDQWGLWHAIDHATGAVLAYVF